MRIKYLVLLGLCVCLSSCGVAVEGELGGVRFREVIDGKLAPVFWLCDPVGGVSK